MRPAAPAVVAPTIREHSLCLLAHRCVGGTSLSLSFSLCGLTNWAQRTDWGQGSVRRLPVRAGWLCVCIKAQIKEGIDRLRGISEIKVKMISRKKAFLCVYVAITPAQVMTNTDTDTHLWYLSALNMHVLIQVS